VRTAASGIRIIHEATDEDAQFSEARTLIEHARRVVFLGFGFGEVNVDRLDLQPLLGQRITFGSAIGMTDRERTRVKVALPKLALDAQSSSLSEFIRCNPVLEN
jgi:hypothetical protein